MLFSFDWTFYMTFAGSSEPGAQIDIKPNAVNKASKLAQ